LHRGAFALKVVDELGCQIKGRIIRVNRDRFGNNVHKSLEKFVNGEGPKRPQGRAFESATTHFSFAMQRTPR
jgi:hypothetical protein